MVLADYLPQNWDWSRLWHEESDYVANSKNLGSIEEYLIEFIKYNTTDKPLLIGQS